VQECSAYITWCVVRELAIAPFQVNNRPELIEVINSVCADTPWMKTSHFEPTLAWTHALENADCPHHLLALARVENRIIGWCRLFPIGSQPGGVELGIGLLGPYRNQGIGTAMMNHALIWAKSGAVAMITLTAHRQNMPAIHLFKKFKFLERNIQDSRLRMDLLL
jgi:GNAT superfamily N-acetyltransferase